MEVDRIDVAVLAEELAEIYSTPTPKWGPESKKINNLYWIDCFIPNKIAFPFPSCTYTIKIPVINVTRMEFGDLFPFQLMSMLDSFLAWPVRKTIHYTAWPIPSPWNQQVSCLDSNSIVHNRCPPMFQNLQLPSKSYVMHLKIYQIIFLGRRETPRADEKLHDAMYLQIFFKEYSSVSS